LIVTSDNDFKLAMDYAAAKGVVVVVLGNLVDFSSAQRSRASDPKKYWDALRVECERRPLSRLKLVQSCDCALIWDPYVENIAGVWFPARGSGMGRWRGSQTT